MNFTLFSHTLLSDWNHGNAHFLRGVVTELVARGHRVRCYEPSNAWSLENLLMERGPEAMQEVIRTYPALDIRRYPAEELDLDEALHGCDVVLVHEWNDPKLVQRIGRARARGGAFKLLFHDTHHRSVTDAAAMSRYDLSAYDGVLAFGETIRQVYLRSGWSDRVWTWHEAADVRVFRPMPELQQERDLVWVGNWGDDERTAELSEFLLDPVRELGLSALVHGVRYPESAKRALAEARIDYRGWLPNYQVPEVFARHRVTLHVPRRPYATVLPGIPTIRVFEALACGIPLVSAPWSDAEGLFGPDDYVMVQSGAQMQAALRSLLHEPAKAAEMAARGLQTILARHTCAHRVDELSNIVQALGAPAEGPREGAPAARMEVM